MIFASAIKRAFDEAFPNAVERALDKVLPGIVEVTLRDRFRDAPDKPLSRVGFEWAFYFGIKRYWTNVSRADTTPWLWEYLDTPYGNPEYSWTARDAEDLAKEYVCEFGE